MKIYFLGTGASQGIPIIGSQDPVSLSTDKKDKRLRSSITVYWDEVTLQIDCGPDFRQQMLESKCSGIDAILMTHQHADHTAGLDDIRPFCFMQKKSMDIYADKRTIASLHQRFDYIFEKENRYPGAPSAESYEIEAFKKFTVKNKVIEPILVYHGNLPILGYKMENFAYLTDVKTLPKQSIQALKGIEVLVVSALKNEQHPTHSNLSEALALIEEISPKKAYITHISQGLGFHDFISKNLPKHVFLAYDNLQIEI